MTLVTRQGGRHNNEKIDYEEKDKTRTEQENKQNKQNQQRNNYDKRSVLHQGDWCPILKSQASPSRP